jgi:RNA polymerase sigma-70 factor (ECF subfamily)
MEMTPGEVTRLIAEIKGGDREASDRLLPLVYKELRKTAAAIMRRERPGHTLQPTAVVHEVYLRIVKGAGLPAENRAHFFALAARAMHQVLVDHARRKHAARRQGQRQRVEFDENNFALDDQQAEEILSLHAALDKLHAVDVRQAEIMEMLYFGGNAVEEIAQAFGISTRTVKRELQTGRLFLKQVLKKDPKQDVEKAESAPA